MIRSLRIPTLFGRHTIPVLCNSDWSCLIYISLDAVWDHYFFSYSQRWQKRGLIFCCYCCLVLFFWWLAAFLQTVIAVFLSHLFSMLNKPNSCDFCHWSHIYSSSAHCCWCPWLLSYLRSFLYEPCLYGLMISQQGRQLYLSPFKSALWDSNFSFSQTMGLEKWWSENPH